MRDPPDGSCFPGAPSCCLMHWRMPSRYILHRHHLVCEAMDLGLWIFDSYHGDSPVPGLDRVHVPPISNLLKVEDCPEQQQCSTSMLYEILVACVTAKTRHRQCTPLDARHHLFGFSKRPIFDLIHSFLSIHHPPTIHHSPLNPSTTNKTLYKDHTTNTRPIQRPSSNWKHKKVSGHEQRSLRDRNSSFRSAYRA